MVACLLERTNRGAAVPVEEASPVGGHGNLPIQDIGIALEKPTGGIGVDVLKNFENIDPEGDFNVPIIGSYVPLAC